MTSEQWASIEPYRLDDLTNGAAYRVSYSKDRWNAYGDMPIAVRVEVPRAIIDQFQGPMGIENLAKFLGYKNANSMGRFVRRMKRRKEKERRDRLKHEARNSRP